MTPAELSRNLKVLVLHYIWNTGDHTFYSLSGNSSIAVIGPANDEYGPNVIKEWFASVAQPSMEFLSSLNLQDVLQWYHDTYENHAKLTSQQAAFPTFDQAEIDQLPTTQLRPYTLLFNSTSKKINYFFNSQWLPVVN
jgi:hypothetical protein